MEDKNSNKRTMFKKQKTEDVSDLLYSKIPPQARELEEAVLGAILIEKDAISYVSDILKPESFYVDAHATIFNSMRTLFDKSEPIDLLTVTEQLRKEGKLEETGGAFYLSELTDKVATSANIVHHARIIVQKYIQRELIRISNNIIRDSYEDTTDVFELHERSKREIESITEYLNKTQTYTINHGVMEILKTISDVESGVVLMPEFSTFLSYLNFYAGQVSVIAAKPGTGKTTFMLNCAKKQALNGVSVGIVTIEMDLVQLTTRIIQEDTGIGGASMLQYKIDKRGQELIRNNSFSDLPIYITPVYEIKYSELYNVVSSLVKKYGCKIVYIDYLQLIGTDDIREQDLKRNENIMRECVKIAKYFKIPIILLSQMSRGDITIENLDEKLRSGGIEQGAAQIIGIDYVDKTEQVKKWKEQGDGVRGMFRILNSKDRFNERFGEKVFYHDMPKQKMYEEKPTEGGEFISGFVEQKFDLF